MNNHRRLNRIERQRLGFALMLSLIAIFLSVILSAVVAVTAAIERERVRTAVIEDVQVAVDQRKRSDVLLCREIEKLKTQNREDARELYRFRLQAIRSLGILTPKVEREARNALDESLFRNRARESSCGEIPILRPSRTTTRYEIR